MRAVLVVDGFLAAGDIAEEIIGAGYMEQLLGESPLARGGAKIILSSGKSSAMAISFRPMSFQHSRRFRAFERVALRIDGAGAPGGNLARGFHEAAGFVGEQAVAGTARAGDEDWGNRA